MLLILFVFTVLAAIAARSGSTALVGATHVVLVVMATMALLIRATAVFE